MRFSFFFVIASEARQSSAIPATTPEGDAQ